jgi:hypothetical protein
MLLLLPLVALSALPPACGHDPVGRAVERNLISSSVRPPVGVQVASGFVYAGCFPFRLGDVATGTRYVFVDAEGARIRRMVIAQFEDIQPGSKEIYRYDMSSAETMGGLKVRPNTFAFGTAEAMAENPAAEGSLTTAYLLRAGYEVPDVWLASRFVALGAPDRRSEMILFYLEPAPSRIGLADLYRGEEATPVWQGLRGPLAERSRQAFAIVLLPAAGAR